MLLYYWIISKKENIITHNCATCTKEYHWICSQEGNLLIRKQVKKIHIMIKKMIHIKNIMINVKNVMEQLIQNIIIMLLDKWISFHFQSTGQCISKSEKCKCCDFDVKDETYKEGYERCEKCIRGGNSNNH